MQINSMLLDYFTYLSFTVLQHARTQRESFAIFLEGGKFINSYFKILSRIIFFYLSVAFTTFSQALAQQQQQQEQQRQQQQQ